MTMREYQQAALRTCRPLSDRDMLLNAAMGICGESGEFIDALKKHVYHDHALDRERMLKELGDVLWYVSLAAHALGSSMEEVARMNIDKLSARYPEGFSVEGSHHQGE